MSNMTELIPVVIVSMILAVLSHGKSVYNRELERYKQKDVLFYTIMLLVLVVFAGLRTGYNDTFTYRYAYELLQPTQSAADAVKGMPIGDNPGFVYVNMIMRRSGISTQSFLMIYSVVTNGIYLWFLRKYTNNIWQTVFLFLVFDIFTFTLAAIKQCVAVAFGLLGVDQALKKHYIRFLFWVMVATLFHVYSLMFLVVPFLMFRPWSARTYFCIVAFGLAGILLEFLLGALIDVTTMFGEGYDIKELSGEGVNPFRLAVCAVPLLISFVARYRIEQMDEKREREFFLFTNLSMLNAEIMFVALFGTANYFARLANYFLIFQTLSIPWLFQFFDKRSRSLLICTAVVCYSLYFIYASGINQNFDLEFDRISFMEYLMSLFETR